MLLHYLDPPTAPPPDAFVPTVSDRNPDSIREEHRANPPSLSFITGRFRSEQACYEGYVYSFDRSMKSGDMYWQCRDAKKYTPRCRARLITVGKDRVRRNPIHNHPPSTLGVLQSAVLSTVSNDNTTESAGNAVRRILSNVPEDVKSELPRFHLMKRRTRYFRKTQRSAPSNPRSAADLVIPPEYRIDNLGKLFLQHDTTTALGKRVLVFSTDIALDACNVSDIDTCFGDGTFKIAPILFEQLWIVRARFDAANLPICYALLQDKTPESYGAVLAFLHLRCPLLNPSTFILDFEVAEHIAVRNVFPRCTIRGCLFHFCQCQLRRFRNMAGFCDDPTLRLLIASVYGLPFVSLADEIAA